MKKALLVIDVQNIYTNPDSEMYCEDSANTVENVNKIIEKFEGTDNLVIYIRHQHKLDGSDLGRMFDFAGKAEDFNFKETSDEVEYDQRLKILENSIHLVKSRYSAFINTGLNEVLVANSIEKLVIIGFMTNFCCDSTAREGHDRDYYIDFITDATGAPAISEEINESVIRHHVSEFLAGGYAEIYSTSTYLNGAD